MAYSKWQIHPTSMQIHAKNPEAQGGLAFPEET
jgi:hypothetical protein